MDGRIGNGEDEKIITLPETYLDSDYVGNYTQRRIQMVDFSDKEPQTVDQLRTLVKNFIKNNKVGVPKVSIKASFVDLASSVISGDLRTLEEVDLCDYVTVAFNELDINTEAQIVKTVWNVHLNRYESIELGEARSSFAKVIIDSQPDVKEIINKVDWLEKAQKKPQTLLKTQVKGT
ncbi:phage tail spike protein [Enterococcus termitis]